MADEPKPATLGDLVRLEQDLPTWCPSCGTHGARLRPEDLISKLGAGCPVPGVARLLRCTRCGRRGGEVTIANRDRTGMVAISVRCLFMEQNEVEPGDHRQVAVELIEEHGERAPAVANALEELCRERGLGRHAAVWRTVAQVATDMLKPSEATSRSRTRSIRGGHPPKGALAN